jgi:hypothetical protein
MSEVYKIANSALENYAQPKVIDYITLLVIYNC